MSHCNATDGKYPITGEYEGNSEIETVHDLREWIRSRTAEYTSYLKEREGFTPEFDSDPLGGLYSVQRSLTYRESRRLFTQKGTGPNYLGNLWTFASCRHMHRGHKDGWNFEQFFTEDPEDSDLLLPTRPVVVINTANSQRLRGESRRPVASVAFVTHGFWTVERYAETLCEVGSERAITARLTHADTATRGSTALEFGDCHADRDGNVSEPPYGHDHHERTDSSCGCSGELLPHKDTATDHVKCLSLPGYWHAFAQPTLELTANVSDRGVKYVQSYSGMDEHLKEYGEI